MRLKQAKEQLLRGAPTKLLWGALAVVPYTSPAALSDQARLCVGKEPYPAEWVWDPAKIVHGARAATAADGLAPKIELVRGGKVVAVFSSFGSNPTTCKFTWPTATTPIDLTAYAAAGCGPVGSGAHLDTFNVLQPGDTLLVHPAYYAGSINSIFLGPKPAYYQGPMVTPTNVTIKGLTENGIRPALVRDGGGTGQWWDSQALVYVFTSELPTIENIDISATASAGVNMAAVYINGAHDLTFRDVAVHDFALINRGPYFVGANGFFGTPNNTGTLTFDHVAVYNNGGFRSSYMHNFYITGSKTDPRFTVHMLNSYTAASIIGHTFKSRAQRTILEGNYFRGSRPNTAEGSHPAEPYLADIPNGGIAVVRDNIFVKTASGLNSNAMSLTFGMEGHNADADPGREQSVTIENNTFVAFTKLFDGTHQLYPMQFFYPPAIPGTPSWHAGVRYSIKRNVFVGYCPTSTTYNPMGNYRGDEAVTLGFADLKKDFSLVHKITSSDTSIIGVPEYEHLAQPGHVRRTSTVGAKD